MKPLALLSVTDKTDIAEFARSLIQAGFEILSTGGTAKFLREGGLAVTDVSDYTGFPEMLDGRVKTLHPKVHGGLLGRRDLPEHLSSMEQHGIRPISVVAVNLYQFSKTVSGPHTFEQAIESIDIGGPSMIRSAAKNSRDVFVVVDPADYPAVIEAIQSGEGESLRRELMAKAFRHTAAYDAAISNYLTADDFAEKMTFTFDRAGELRYGENPHQKAAVYRDPSHPLGIPAATVLWGKELSYNNLLDADAAWELVCDLPEGSCAIIKHGNPCGAAFGVNMAEAYAAARASDPISAFGGIAAFHGEVDLAAAQAMTEKGNFLEVILAERITEDALELFRNKSGWGQNVRILQCPVSPNESYLQLRSIRGGLLLQSSDADPCFEWEVVSERQPTDEEWAALRFQWHVVRHIKSNAIAVGTASRLLGVGAGQMNRVQSVRLALEQAGEQAKGAALASDAFFPFADSIETAAAAGIRAIVQPGGSKKDQDSIESANRNNLAMVFTGVRHFKH